MHRKLQGDTPDFDDFFNRTDARLFLTFSAAAGAVVIDNCSGM